MANKDIFGPSGVDKEFLKKAIEAKGFTEEQPSQGKEREVSRHYKTRRPSASEHEALIEKHANLTEMFRQLSERHCTLQNDFADLRRESQHRVEQAIDDYESVVLGKLADVAQAHNAIAKENSDLKARLKSALDTNTDENEKVEEKTERLATGDEVYLKVTGEGPFVLTDYSDNAIVEWKNPDSKNPNCFRVGQHKILGAWIMRCKDGSYRTQPAAVLTKEPPQRRVSFERVKLVLGSSLLGNLVQFAAWGALLAYVLTR